MTKFKDTIDNHPIIIICTFLFLGFGAGWSSSEYIRVNPIQSKFEEKTLLTKEYKEKLKKYGSFDKNSEFDSFIVYDSDDWLSEETLIAILGGQVSIKLENIISQDNVSFIIDSEGEKELQFVSSSPNERAKFVYDGKKYVINIKEFLDFSTDNEVKLSISEIK